MTRANALGELSARNASTSSGEGGRPIKSNVARRIKVRLSAGSAGLNPFCSKLAKMKRSIADRAHDWSRTSGASTALIGWNAQNRRCSSVNGPMPLFCAGACVATLSLGQGRPIATQRDRTSTSRSFNFCLGGILGSSW